MHKFVTAFFSVFNIKAPEEKKHTYKRLYVRSYVLPISYERSYVLQNMYVLSYVRSYVLLISYVGSYVLPNSYGRSYVLPFLFIYIFFFIDWQDRVVAGLNRKRLSIGPQGPS